MPTDIFLYAGEPKPNDIKLCDPTVLCAGGSPVTYTYVATGGIVFGGSATIATTHAYTPTGGVVFGGTGTTSYVAVAAPVVFAGSGDFEIRHGKKYLTAEYLPTGGLVFGGHAAVSRTFAAPPPRKRARKFHGAAKVSRTYAPKTGGRIRFIGRAETSFVSGLIEREAEEFAVLLSLIE